MSFGIESWNTSFYQSLVLIFSMIALLVIPFIIKLYAQNNNFWFSVLDFTVKSVTSCSLIHYFYTTHANIVELHDVRIKSKFFRCRTLCWSHYVKYTTHTINICYQKENRLVVVPFTANDVFKMMEITFIPRVFSYLLSILASALTVLLLWHKFPHQKIYQWMSGC